MTAREPTQLPFLQSSTQVTWFHLVESVFIATRRPHLCDVCITSLVYRVYRFGPIYFTVVFLLSHSVRLSRAQFNTPHSAHSAHSGYSLCSRARGPRALVRRRLAAAANSPSVSSREPSVYLMREYIASRVLSAFGALLLDVGPKGSTGTKMSRERRWVRRRVWGLSGGKEGRSARATVSTEKEKERNG